MDKADFRSCGLPLGKAALIRKHLDLLESQSHTGSSGRSFQAAANTLPGNRQDRSEAPSHQSGLLGYSLQRGSLGGHTDRKPEPHAPCHEALLDSNSSGSSGKQLRRLVLRGDFEGCAAMLKDSPAALHGRDGSGYTALHYAAQHGFIDIVKLLIHESAEINAIRGGDRHHETPLDTARYWAEKHQRTNDMTESNRCRRVEQELLQNGAVGARPKHFSNSSMDSRPQQQRPERRQMHTEGTPAVPCKADHVWIYVQVGRGQGHWVLAIHCREKKEEPFQAAKRLCMEYLRLDDLSNRVEWMGIGHSNMQAEAVTRGLVDAGWDQPTGGALATCEKWQAVGIGSNKEKVQRAGYLALALSVAVARGLSCSPRDSLQSLVQQADRLHRPAGNSGVMRTSARSQTLDEISERRPRGRSRTRRSDNDAQGCMQQLKMFWRAATDLLASIEDTQHEAAMKGYQHEVPLSSDTKHLIHAFSTLPTCTKCRSDLHEVLDAVETIAASSRCDQRVLEACQKIRSSVDPPGPSSEAHVAIQELQYLQADASDTFSHGAHAGKPVHDLVEDLVAGRVSLDDKAMTLDITIWHGKFWSFNTRHLRALKDYAKTVQPEALRAKQKALVKIWPLAPGVKLHRHEVIEKFCDAYSTRDEGRSLSLRSSSRASSSGRSASRHRVHFVAK
eukprot:TRINITY_DN27219_c0_g1_i1.p1 TRINITY_DN27219_c0_g1~~TRINITY_DN27219_c0_g1_i1.p1  ORF type:complete len:734 (+),score=92.41 TRINITY_DN27219_c0_g1_i1:183-2204(+)